MLEVLNLVVGVIGIIVTVIGTVVAVQQLRLQQRLAAPATVTDHPPADTLAPDDEPVNTFVSDDEFVSDASTQPWPAAWPAAARPAAAEGGVRAMPAPVGLTVLLLLLLTFLFAWLAAMAVADPDGFPTLVHRIGLGAILAHLVAVPALLAALIARGRGRAITIAFAATVSGMASFIAYYDSTKSHLELVFLLLSLPVILLLARPASDEYFTNAKRWRRYRRPLRQRSKIIKIIASLVILDGVILTSTSIYANQYNQSAEALARDLPSRPASSGPGWDGKPSGAVSIEELSTFFPDPDSALRHFREHGAKRAAVQHWATSEQVVLIILVELADEETARRYVATVTPADMVAQGSFGPPDSAWFTRESPDQDVVVSMFQAAEAGIVGIVYVWDYADSDFTDETRIATNLMLKVRP